MDKFDGEKGFKAISYSVWWIKQMIIDALNKRNSLIADDLPSDVDEPERVIENDNYCFKDEKMLDDSFIDEDSYERLKTEEELKCLSNIMCSLSEREQEIIKMYYGINGYKQKNLEEIRKRIWDNKGTCKTDT